jgi:hypothetical protein
LADLWYWKRNTTSAWPRCPQQFAEGDAQIHAEQHPDSQVAFKKGQPLRNRCRVINDGFKN